MACGGLPHRRASHAGTHSTPPTEELFSSSRYVEVTLTASSSQVHPAMCSHAADESGKASPTPGTPPEYLGDRGLPSRHQRRASPSAARRRRGDRTARHSPAAGPAPRPPRPCLPPLGSSIESGLLAPSHAIQLDKPSTRVGDLRRARPLRLHYATTRLAMAPVDSVTLSTVASATLTPPARALLFIPGLAVPLYRQQHPRRKQPIQLTRYGG